MKQKTICCIDGVNSYLRNNSCCIPQGFVLRPLLLTLYINDIFFFFFGVHPLWMTTTSSSSLNVGLTVDEEANA